MLRQRNVLLNRKSTIISHFNFEYIVMTSITKEDEELLDQLNDSDEWEDRYIKIENNKNNIKCSNILLYGDINFKDEDTINMINKKKLIDEEPFHLTNIYSKLDYDKGVIISDLEGIFRYHQTYNKVKVLMLNHCFIGKPEKIIVYKTKDVSTIKFN